MREVGMRHLEQNEQRIDHGKLSTDEGSGRGMEAWGKVEAQGGPRGTKTQSNTGSQPIPTWFTWLPRGTVEDQKGQEQRLCHELQHPSDQDIHLCPVHT